MNALSPAQVLGGVFPLDAPLSVPQALLQGLRSRAEGLDDLRLLELVIGRLYHGRIAVVSSFGAESAVLLDLVARVDRGTPVLFLDTLKHFPATLRYLDELVDHLGLTAVRGLRPDPAALAAEDPDDKLWSRDADRCCHLRKVVPLQTELRGFDAWINGRKRFHGGARGALERLELVDGRLKVNPLAHWSAEQVKERFLARGLPRHPMVAKGYASIGCLPCTAWTGDEEAGRAGRWAGLDKTECGIHNRPASFSPVSRVPQS